MCGYQGGSLKQSGLRNKWPLFSHQAVKLTSSRTQLPYEYYSLPFCQPLKITYKAENLGKFSLTAVNLPQWKPRPFFSNDDDS